MSLRLATLLVVIVLFGVLTAIALADVGVVGIFRPHFQSWGPAQVFADLVILAVLASFWMVRDGRAHGLAPWPFVILTAVAGSFGPLLYLVYREVRSRPRRPITD
jgi:energy-converting hydrogenase Eha subunit A